MHLPPCSRYCLSVEKRCRRVSSVGGKDEVSKDDEHGLGLWLGFQGGQSITTSLDSEQSVQASAPFQYLVSRYSVKFIGITRICIIDQIWVRVYRYGRNSVNFFQCSLELSDDLGRDRELELLRIETVPTRHTCARESKMGTCLRSRPWCGAILNLFRVQED